jgi:hypothetical protein
MTFSQKKIQKNNFFFLTNIAKDNLNPQISWLARTHAETAYMKLSLLD